MSVEKFTVTTASTNFTSIPNNVLQNLNNATALGLWCYFISMPPSWEFYKDQIQSHFHIGRDKLLKILSILKNHNLIEIQAIKNEKGQIEKWNLHIKNGNEFTHTTENAYPGKTTLLKNQSLENQGLVSAGYKRNTKKKHTAIKETLLLPEWLSDQLWSSFLAHRQHLKAPPNEHAKKLALTTLTKLKDEGHDIIEVVNQTILNGWKGFFPIKKQSTQGSYYGNKRKSNSSIHFDSCKGSLKGTIYDPDNKPEEDPFI